MAGFVPKRYTSLVFAFYMSALMALLMSTVLVAINTGTGGNFFMRVLHSYAVAMPIAFFCVSIVRPFVTRLVMMTIKQD